MQNKRKTLFEILFLVLVAGFTLWSIFHGKDVEAILHYTKEADPRYIALSIVCVFFFIWGESVILFYMLRSFHARIPAGRCYLYSCIGFFFSCITPSATGGQPAQIYYMNKDNIPVPVSTVILMVVTITYKLVLVVVGGAVLLFRPQKVMYYLQPVLPWCYLGIALNIFCVTFMCFLVFHPYLAERILLWLLELAEKLHLLRRKQERREKLRNGMQVYQETAAYLAGNKRIVVHAFFITVLQRFALFFVTSLTYLAFGYSGESLFDLLLLQAMISVSVDMLPLPGGMGISEGLFLHIFRPIFGAEFTIPAMLVSRGISYYGQLFISAVLTVYANFRIGRGRQRKGMQSE
ncbi:MAG: YbhN family protein [Lachnospiraceae bacterium]